jgi:hypothetical protein
MTTLADIRARALAQLMPPERLPLSQWIEREIVKRHPGDAANRATLTRWPPASAPFLKWPGSL